MPIDIPVDPKKLAAAEAEMAALNKRFGGETLDVAKEDEQVPRLSTGIVELDGVLCNGLPITKLTACIGAPGSGATTLVTRVVGNVQQRGEHVVYIDSAHRFDPEAAAFLGVDLHRLLLIRPKYDANPLAIARDLLDRGDSSLIVIDAFDMQLTPLTEDIRRFRLSLALTSCAAVILNDHLSTPLSPLVHTLIEITRLACHQRGQRILAIQSRIRAIDKTGKRETLLVLHESPLL